MRHYYRLAVVFCAVTAFVPGATAQSSVASSSCSDFRNATDPAQLAQYSAYLEAYANAHSPDPRFTTSATALADDAKKVRDWCGKNKKRTYGEAVSAIVGSASSGAASAAAQAAPPAEPTSCKVGATKGCPGCSITCTGGKQAECRPPSDSGIKDDQGNPECAMHAWCYCKK
jgi:hypothetical protein